MQKKDNSYSENSGGHCFEDPLLHLISQMAAIPATLSETFPNWLPESSASCPSKSSSMAAVKEGAT